VLYATYLWIVSRRLYHSLTSTARGLGRAESATTLATLVESEPGGVTFAPITKHRTPRMSMSEGTEGKD